MYTYTYIWYTGSKENEINLNINSLFTEKDLHFLRIVPARNFLIGFY